jgi:hypothetical protein
MMKLENVKTLEDMVDYAEDLASDIRLGIESVDGKWDAELIADLVVHCMNLAESDAKKEFIEPWISLSDKQPKLSKTRTADFLQSDTILVKTSDGTIYDAHAYKFDNDAIDYFTVKGLYNLQNVVEWMEKPK